MVTEERGVRASVMSTIASTKSGTFTSVAPQENSTSTETFCFAKYRFTVPTSSVATRLPARSATFRIDEASGTHRTQRAFRFEARDVADSVHVALHEMAPEFLHRRQRAFEIYAPARLHFAETRPSQRFAGEIGRETFT